MDWMIATENPNGEGYLFPKDLPDSDNEPIWTLWETPHPDLLAGHFISDSDLNEFGLYPSNVARNVDYYTAWQVASDHQLTGTPIGG